MIERVAEVLEKERTALAGNMENVEEHVCITISD
jgi:hypothetical protein